jgi:hypothetical protein
MCTEFATYSAVGRWNPSGPLMRGLDLLRNGRDVIMQFIFEDVWTQNIPLGDYEQLAPLKDIYGMAIFGY